VTGYVVFGSVLKPPGRLKEGTLVAVGIKDVPNIRNLFHCYIFAIFLDCWRSLCVR
jgi:hypothetical protein